MRASILDLRRRMRDILRALDRNEPVTILYRGKEKAILYPAGRPHGPPDAVVEHSAFGMWKDRKDMDDVKRLVRDLRKGRTLAV